MSNKHTATALLKPQGNMQQLRVVAVVVSYNRRELLNDTLAALRAQTRRPDAIVVVDNNSSDGAATLAADRLALWADRGKLLSLTTNTGGAGGFAAGIAAALEFNFDGHAADWVWVMDDDTVPRNTALATALAAHREYAATGPDSLAVMGSRVVWTNGAAHPMNTPKAKLGAGPVEQARAAACGAVPIRSISFVSAFLRTSRIHELGLPITDYFLWNDDFEYTARLLNGAAGLLVPQSTVVHKTKALGSSDNDPGPRFSYEVRNKLWLFRYSKALKCSEKPLYAAATARRWIRTLRSSSDRRQLLRAGWEGLRAAVAARPRPNAELLADAGLADTQLQLIKQLEQSQPRVKQQRVKQSRAKQPRAKQQRVKQSRAKQPRAKQQRVKQQRGGA